MCAAGYVVCKRNLTGMIGYAPTRYSPPAALWMCTLTGCSLVVAAVGKWTCQRCPRVIRRLSEPQQWLPWQIHVCRVSYQWRVNPVSHQEVSCVESWVCATIDQVSAYTGLFYHTQCIYIDIKKKQLYLMFQSQGCIYKKHNGKKCYITIPILIFKLFKLKREFYFKKSRLYSMPKWQHLMENLFFFFPIKGPVCQI